MTALRASYSIAPEILQRFNALVPTSERSKTVQSLMESILELREKNLKAIANEFATHPDFAEARADGLLWDGASLDGLTEPLAYILTAAASTASTWSQRLAVNSRAMPGLASFYA